MSEQRLYRHLSDRLKQAVPESTDLWPRIRRQVAAPRPARRPVPRIAWALAAALALALGGVAVAIALSPAEEAASIIYGVDDIYQASLYTEVNQSQQLGEVTVTVSWVYADPNLLLVAYSQEGAANPGSESEARLISAIDETSGIELQPMEGAGYDRFWIFVYQMPPELSAASDLHLQLTFQGTRWSVPTVPLVTPTAPPVTQTGSSTTFILEPTIQGLLEVTGIAAFYMTVPVTPGRTIEVGQQIQAEGLSMTLERIVLAPSSARADVCFDVPDATNYEWFVWGKLSAGFQSVEGGSKDFVSGQAQPCAPVLFEDQLTLDAAHYTLRMREIVGFRLDAPGEQWRIAGPWVFEIEVTE